jgi:putative membrane protein
VTCCLLLTLWVGGVTDRRFGHASPVTLGRRRDPRLAAMLGARLGPRWRQWLVTVAVAELAAAWVLVQAMIALDRHAMPAVMKMAVPGGASSRSDAVISLLLAGWLGAGVVVVGAQLSDQPTARRWWASSRACAYVAFAGYGLALLAPVRAAATASHLVLMAQTMLLLVVAPALLAVALQAGSAHAGGPRAGWSSRLGPLPWLAAGAYLVVLYGWHLPVAHTGAINDQGVDWLRIASTTGAGLALWRFVVSDRVRASDRLAALITVGAGSGLLGIAFLLSPRALMPMATGSTLGWSALTDQRLAGLLMMAVDVAVLLPVAGRVAAVAWFATPRRSTG